MDTMMLDQAMQSAMQQMGTAATQGAAVIAILMAVLLSMFWMAAGLLRDTPEI